MEPRIERALYVCHFLLISLALASMVGIVTRVAAQQTHYLDVEAGVWYEDAAAALLASGALDQSEVRLRPNDLATRAEVAKMLVLVYGNDLIYPETQSFADVPPWTWYYPYVETAARAGWMRGDANCYGVNRPCNARPADNVNRAEMAILLDRAFALDYTGLAPVFPDNRQGEWYFTPIQTAADHCILQGDDNSGNVRPASFMNRAEMIVMFHRASENLTYGEDCSTGGPAADISSVSVEAADRIRVNFTVGLDRTLADDEFRYKVERIGGGSVTVSNVTIIDDGSVELDLGSALIANATYRITVTDLRTEEGDMFNDTSTFLAPSGLFPAIMDIDVQAADTIRVIFNVDVDHDIANDTNRYTVANVSGGASLAIEDIRSIDDRTIEMQFVNDLDASVTYLLTATSLRSEAGVLFSDTATFRPSEPVADLASVSALSATRIRLTFNTPLDEIRAEEVSHYQVTTGTGTGTSQNVSVGLATAVGGDGTIIELTLDETLQTQREYLVTATDLRTAGGVTFSDSRSFLYVSPGTPDVQFRATLTGAQEVPPVVTTSSGTGTFILTPSGLAYDITVLNLTGSAITSAHFHRGAVGVSGPIVEPISFNNTTRVTGTWTDLTANERNDILNGMIYVNVHTPGHPDGEIRGQLVLQ